VGGRRLREVGGLAQLQGPELALVALADGGGGARRRAPARLQPHRAVEGVEQQLGRVARLHQLRARRPQQLGRVRAHRARELAEVRLHYFQGAQRLVYKDKG